MKHKKNMKGVIALVECSICKLIESRQLTILYEDQDSLVVLADRPTAPGHVIVIPKEHYAILEQVPDSIIGKLGLIVNKVSISVFEVLGSQGTNVLVNNGIIAGQKQAHFMINILPRKEGDGLDFLWTPKKLSEDEMSNAETRIKDHTIANPIVDTSPKAPEKLLPDTEKYDDKEEEENYLLKQLRRIP